MQYTRYPVQGGGNGVATYANLASFPLTAADGTLAIALDTGYLYEYRTTDNAWHLIAGPDIVVGAPNTFAGFNASGILDPIPGWEYNATTDGAQVALTIDPVATGSSTINVYDLEIVPSADTNNTITGTQFNNHYDRTSGNFNLNSLINGVNVVMNHEGSGHVDTMRALNVDTTAGVGKAGTLTDFRGIDLTMSIGSTFTVDRASGLEIFVNNQGAINNNLTLASLASSNTSIGGNFSGIFLNNQTNADLDNIQIQLGSSGTTGNNFFTINANNTGDVTSNYYGISNVNSGDIGGTFTALNLGSQGTIGNGASYININSQSDVTQNLYGVNINNSGDATSDITMFNAYNSGVATSNFHGMVINNSANQPDSAIGFNVFNSGNITNNLTLGALSSSGNAGNAFTGLAVNFSGTAPYVAGVDINLGAATATGGPKTALNISGGRINAAYDYNGAPGAVFEFGNFQYASMNVLNGTPLTGTEEFMHAYIGAINADDNMTTGPLGLGAAFVGLLGNTAVTSGHTVDAVNCMLAGSSIPAGSTGGTVTDMSMYRAFGLFSQGGTLNITNLYGLKLDAGFSSSAANSWSLYSPDTNTKLLSAGEATLGSAILNNATGLTVPYFDVSKKLVSSAVTNTELGYVSGVTSSIQTQLNGKQASGNYITALTGDVTASGPGSAAATLATVNSNVGSFTSANITVDAKGRITAASSGGGSGANTALSNLASVAINASLVPASNGAISLGANTLAYNTLFLDGVIRNSSNTQLADLFNHKLYNSGSSNTLDWQTGYLANNSSVSVLTWNAAGSGTNINLPNLTASLPLKLDGSKNILAAAIDLTGSEVTGALPITKGGTGQTTKAPAFDALSPMTTGGDLIYGGASGTGTRLPNGSAGQVLQSNGGTTAPSWANPTIQTINYYDGQANNTNGGTFTSGSFITRVLNGTFGSQSWASLSSNQITLTAGTYQILASAPAYKVARHQARLQNITDASTAAVGTSEYSDTTNDVTTRSCVNTIVTIASTKVFELQHRCQTTSTTSGLGVAANFGVGEVYSQIQITKIA